MSPIAPYLRAALRFWWVVVLVAVLGGGTAYLGSGQTSWTSTQLFRVNANDSESARATQLTQTLSRVVDSDEVFARAGAATDTDANSFRGRTVVAAVTDTEILSVTVTAPDPTAATDDVRAFDEAVRVVLLDQGRSLYLDAGAAANGAISSGGLADPAAEEARRTQIGQSTAEQQNSALAASAQLSRIGDVGAPIRAGLGGGARLALGTAAGAALGLLLVIVFGPGLLTVRRRSDLDTVQPPIEMFDRNGARRIAARLRGRPPRVIAIVSLARDRDERTAEGHGEVAPTFAAALREAFIAQGVKASVGNPRLLEIPERPTEQLSRAELAHHRSQVVPSSARREVAILHGTPREELDAETLDVDLVVLVDGHRVRDYQRARSRLTHVPMMAVVP